jgi:hypothetical protein
MPVATSCSVRPFAKLGFGGVTDDVTFYSHI